MANELRNLRINNGLSTKDVLTVIQKYYPSFDKSMLSKCERGEQYGITIRPKVMQAIIDELIPDAQELNKRRIRGGHLLEHKVQARLESDVYSQLQHAIRQDGYQTMQDFLSDMVKTYLKERSQ